MTDQTVIEAKLDMVLKNQQDLIKRIDDLWEEIGALNEKWAKQYAAVGVLQSKAHTPAECSTMKEHKELHYKSKGHTPSDCGGLKEHKEEHVKTRTLVLGVIGITVSVGSLVLAVVKALIDLFK